MVRGLVFDVKKFSIHDGPGVRTTVFLKGCPLRCAWCHNPESQALGPELIFYQNRCLGCGACQAACQQGAISLAGGQPVTNEAKCALCGACVEACYSEARQIVGWEMTVAEVLAEVERDVVFYDESGGGVTISGGEPLLQPDFLLALLRACRAREIHTALDTCGYAPWEALDRVRPYVDLFLYDLKLMDEARHRRWTGASNQRILATLRALAERGHEIVVRLPVIPGVNDDAESIGQIGRFVAALPGSQRVELLPYHHTAADKYGRLERPYALPETRPPIENRMAEIRRMLVEFPLEVKIGG